MKGYLRAFLVAPLVVPILYWAGLLLQALADPDRRRAALEAPFAGLGYVLAIGTPIAYAATLVASVPAIWLVRHAGKWALAAMVVLGGVVGLVVTLVLSPYLRGDLFSVILSPLGGAGLGAASAGAFWWLAPQPTTLP
jgi:hypothetical protein